ncbi:hypothetical protein ACWEPC_01840 [Nonomuraea sp. NPDC004297]
MLTTRVRPLLVVPSTRWPATTPTEALDGDALAVEVDVSPAEVEQFSATSAGVGGQMEEGVEAV